jgi:hypothetical protein
MFGGTQAILNTLGPRTGSQRRTDHWMVGQLLMKTDPMRYVQMVQEARELALEEAATKLGITKG